MCGPLWQGGYRAKLVNDQSYLYRLPIYIHLKPVTAGLVADGILLAADGETCIEQAGRIAWPPQRINDHPFWRFEPAPCDTTFKR